mgnify:CR=1 FL=1
MWVDSSLSAAFCLIEDSFPFSVFITVQIAIVNDHIHEVEELQRKKSGFGLPLRSE